MVIDVGHTKHISRQKIFPWKSLDTRSWRVMRFVCLSDVRRHKCSAR